ncbi:hypothetical protein SAMD00023353_2201030 [Rosellinia necatrix]|uniref:Gfd2/YDR514C-like C-terminal domain-containing protein n=1 Tax=Rosellinia necatrix TaxID=77044 RepID=A0A1S7UNZ8_ROSNE|nr:hypothetical protein SAMD00023353_2201030 [Rosellinia necatrix]
MSIAPPGFLPVLLGHGSFLRDRNDMLRRDGRGDPLYVIPTTDNFLEMRPSIESQQFWPARPGDGLPIDTSVVLLSITVNTDCQAADTVTEVGYTIFDTAAIYTGVGGRKTRIPTCMAPGPRGENMTKLALSRHFIVKQTSYHHPGTCDSPVHTAQPYHFSYRKSEFIHNREVPQRLEEAFTRAACEGIEQGDARRGVRRVVVLVGWGDENHHPLVRATLWYTQRWFFEEWDVRKHPLVYRRMPNPTYLPCLEAFGIQHRAYDKEIGHNAGNRSAFTMQLLIALCFLTEDQRARIHRGLSLEPSDRFPGVESVLARVNRPPGAGPLPSRHVPILH